MCFYVDPATLEGTCVGYCEGPNPPWMTNCEELGADCRRDPVEVGGPELLCLPTCNPLAQQCPAGQGCYRLTVDGWFCEPNPNGGTGVTGDTCTEDLDCASGFVCANDESLADCDGQNCCTQLCEVGLDEQCPNYPLETCEVLSNQQPQLGLCRA